MCWKIWALWHCQTLPPCWDTNCWPCRDSFGVSSTLKKKKTSDNNNNNKDADVRECSCSSLGLKTLHFSFSQIWTQQTCMWQAAEPVFTATGVQMGKHFYGRTTETSKQSQRKHVSLQSPRWPRLSSHFQAEQHGHAEANEPHGLRWEGKHVAEKVWGRVLEHSPM